MTDDAENTETTDETPEAVADAPAESTAPAAAAEPEVQLTPKERRKSVRGRHTGEARPQRDAATRDAERRERRAKKAVARRAWRVKSRERRRAASSGEGTPPAEKVSTGARRVRQGVVVSDKADKTITVRIDMARPHRTYGKIVRTSATLHAHDERNEAGAGDTVRVVESRPLSRSKRWRLVEIVERAR